MIHNSVDATTSARIADLGRQVLAGHAVTPDEAHWLFHLENPTALVDLMAWANRIREYHHGRRIHLCSIVNAKAGGCPEDCRFCAQSAFYQTATPRHEFIATEPVLRAAEEAKANGVTGLGIVAAWKGLREGPLLDEICARIKELAESGLARADASLGMIPSQSIADRLREAGLACYNHNLETSRRFFPEICTTHRYEDRWRTIQHLKRAGIRVCSGGILGMGETRQDRCELALALRDLDVDMVPINILNPIVGTPCAGIHPPPPLEIMQMIACFRFVLPRQQILVAGGRVVNLRDLQCLAFLAGCSALMVGNYLTTINQSVEQDLRMLKDLELEPWGAQHRFPNLNGQVAQSDHLAETANRPH